MNIGILGLGLIGGSIAKAYHNMGHKVFAMDVNDDVLSVATIDEIIVDRIKDNNLGNFDIIFLCAMPDAIISFIKTNATKIKKDSLVIDCCGNKRCICDSCFNIAKENGFIFVGGHPMAGSHKGGYTNSRASLFKGASMVIVPPYSDMYLLDRLNNALKPLELKNLTISTADKHDEIIAFSSQLAHIISNAYVKNKTARKHKGFSAGSYKDLTRVAKLNANMWSDLIFDNRDNVIKELTTFIKSLEAYNAALKKENKDELKRLLLEGNDIKREIDR